MRGRSHPGSAKALPARQASPQERLPAGERAGRAPAAPQPSRARGRRRRAPPRPARGRRRPPRRARPRPPAPSGPPERTRPPGCTAAGAASSPRGCRSSAPLPCRRAARAAPGRRCPSKRLQLLGPAVPPPQHRQSALPRQAVSSWPLRAAPRARRRRGASTARRARAPRRSGQARPRTNCLLRRHPAPLTRLVRRRPAPQPAAAAAGAACPAVRRRLEGWGRLCGRRMPQPRCGERRPPRSGGAAGDQRRSGRQLLARLRAPAQCALRPRPCARMPHCSSACTPAPPSGRAHTRVNLCELAGTLCCGPQICCRPRCLSHPPSSHRLCCSHTTEGGHCECSTVQDG